MTKRIKSIFLLVVLCLSMVISLAGCGTSDHTCLKCGGSGRVRDEYGYYAYVACPRCGGSGKLNY